MSRFFDQLTELAGLYPINDAFIEALRQRVIRECSKVPVQVHKRMRAERRLELAACEAIVAMWQETYLDAWFPITMRRDWPRAICIIKGNTARISFSIGPETEDGGQEIEPVEFAVVRTPPNIISKALRAFNKRDPKAEREREFAPVGTPDGRPELKLNQPVDQKQAFRAQTAKKPIDSKAVMVAPKSERSTPPPLTERPPTAKPTRRAKLGR